MCSKNFVSAMLIMNKNRLLFSLFESYYFQCIVDSACLIFHDYSSLILLLYVHVSHWDFFPLQGDFWWSLSIQERNKLSDGQFNISFISCWSILWCSWLSYLVWIIWLDKALIVLDNSGPLPGPQIYIDNNEEKGCGEVAAGALVRLL